jgi:CheY-like chemotaxis protein
MIEFPFHQIVTGHKSPVVTEAAPPRAEAAVTCTPRVKWRVLVMDDEQSILEMTGRMLQSQGYDVTLTSDGQTAVARYREALAEGNRFDVIILDLTVPAGMGGYETFTTIRGFDPGVKAIVSSGYSHEPVVLRYKELGIAGLAPKPYRLNELLAAVSGVLEVA